MNGVPEPTLTPVPIMELRPTQITVGMREVDDKRHAWREKGEEGAKFLGSHIFRSSSAQNGARISSTTTIWRWPCTLKAWSMS